MAGEAWTGPEFIDGIKVLTDADTALGALEPTVKTYTYFPSPTESLTDALIIGYRVRDDTEWAALAERRTDARVLVECQIEIYRPGAGETVAKAARDRAVAILERVHVLVRDSAPDVGTQTIEAKIDSREMQQYPAEIGEAKTPVRVCAIDFAIGYTTRTI